MDRETAKQRIEALRREIRRHDHLYYVEDAPEVSDRRYDELFKELGELEERFPELRSADSPTQRVAGAPVDAFPTVVHTAPMLSLDSDREEDALRRFDERVRKAADEVRYVLEPKLDGLSVELVYEDGLLVRASTRGDGTRGEGITENVRTIGSVPLRLHHDDAPPPGLLAVRGEVIMRLGAFQRLNERLSNESKPTFANPRNAAAGSLRQLDARITAARPLDACFYDVLHAEGAAFATQREILDALRGWGLKVSELVDTVEDVEGILAYHAHLEELRDELDYEIDGIVIKLDDLAGRTAMGVTSRHPRWAFAFKFPPRKETTRVIQILASVGRTGVVTPVAMLRPIEIGGVTVGRATLHNREEVTRLDVREGDTVRVQRAGDVIPQVIERLDDGRERSEPFRMPAACPSCGAELLDRGPFTFCPNSFECPAQRAGRLQHFASRDALDIEGLGEETARLLVEQGLVTTPFDLFELGVEQLTPLEGFAEKSAANLVEAIARSAEVELHRFLYGLGIPEVGVKVARDLALHFRSLGALRAAAAEGLQEVGGVGPRMAEQIVAFFSEERNRAILDALLLRVRVVEPEAAKHGALEGVTFVFTGALETMTRREAQQVVESHGGKAAASVSGSTSYVVAGGEAGSKLEEARKRGVAVLSEDEFRALLADRGIVPEQLG